MDFDFDNVIPLVQTKKKYATFTVTEIGGPEEIIKWRAQQQAKQEAIAMAQQMRDQRLLDFEKEQGIKLDAPTLHNTSWEEKVMFVASERERLAKLEHNVRAVDLTWFTSFDEPKPSIFNRIKSFVGSIWANANFQ